ncbi:glycosyltransferase [Gramella sp. AN32]|uniref:Glycosyltransferase n=1 Tax=Christiangramia antarctica TaxID=2058158 RepID=A0ABW5X405_9FLAO|nr:glycosyltransferase [Gramella sp. AN32]MCM4154964.1 hypothetical protein [Gramella sp. AN32]
MKIALIAHNRFPIAEPYAGGLEMITHLLAKQLMAQHHEVDLYALKNSDPSINIIPLDDSIIDWGNLNSTEETDDLMYAMALQKIEAKSYDIVHNHSMHHLPIILGEHSKNQFITTFHTPVFTDIHKGLSLNKSHSRQIFTMVSGRLGEVYKYLIPKHETVYNGVDVRAWTYNPSPVKDQYCWLGRICKEKAPHLAIEAVLKKGKKIVLAGPVSCETYFEESITPYLNNNKVSYLGHLNHSEINKLIGSSVATLFTSVWDEPYGLVIAESLACGTPVISWNVGAAPEILTSKCGIIVPAFDLNKFGEALINVEKLDRLESRKRAIEFCDVSIMVNAYLELYRKHSSNRILIQNIAV